MPQLLAILVALAVISAQILYGGLWRPSFAIPAYSLVALAAIGAVFVRPPRMASLPGTLSVMALAAWLFWSDAHSPEPLAAGAFFRLTLACALCYFLFSHIVVAPQARLWFISLLLVLAVINTLVGAWQFTRPDATTPLPWFSEQIRIWFEHQRYGRAQGLYLSGNWLVWFLNINALFALSLACWGRVPVWARLLLVYAAGVSFVGVVMCVSRGGLLALAAGMFVFVVLSGVVLVFGSAERRWVTSLGLLVSIGLVIGAGFLIYSHSFKAQGRFNRLTNDDYRSTIWKVAFREAQLQPLTGTGVGTFTHYVKALRTEDIFGDDVFAHNDWLELTTAFGFPALALLLIVVSIHCSDGWTSLRRALQARREEESSSGSNSVAIKVGAMACLAVCVVHSYFDLNMQVPANALLASACLGMLAGTNENLRHPSFRFITRALFLLGGAVLLFAVVRSARPDWLCLRAENALVSGDMVTAEKLSQEGLSLAPHHYKLNHILAQALLQNASSSRDPAIRHKLARASLAVIDDSISACPLDTELYRFRCNAAIVADQPEELLLSAQELIRRNPFNPLGYEFQALSLENQEEWAQAYRLYQIASSLPASDRALRRMKAISDLQKLRPVENP
ncbi:MAG: O-antigen ligase family protein [Saprospiraceae bacterium]